MPRTLMFLFAILLVFSGCPADDDDVTGDDDSADDDTGDDDTGDDDTGDDDTGDDDTGDDDTVPEGVTMTGPEGCEPIESMIYTYWAEGGPPSVTTRLSTVPDYCQVYGADWEIFAANFTDYEAYLLAITEERGPDACNALRTFLVAYQPSFEDLAPPGSCTITIEVPSYNGDGTYATFSDPEDNFIAWGTVALAGESLVGEVLAALGDCSQVVDWDAWVALTATTEVDKWRESDIWGLQEGEIEFVGASGSALHMEGGGMDLFHPDGSGHLSVNIDVDPCGLTSSPPGW